MKFDVPGPVIHKLFNNGYEEQLVDFALECENMGNIEVSDIPLSPLLIKNSNDNVIISEEVYDEYKKLIIRINDSNTSEEIPFLLLGNRKKIDNKDYIIFEEIVYDLTNAVSDTSATIDEDIFRNKIKDSNYSVISIGHTHGNVDENTKNKTLARTISDKLKFKYSIRDTGLNVSVADIWQHEAFKEIGKKLSPNKEIMQTIIMYNGDIIMINSNKIEKANNIKVVFKNGDIFIVNGELTEDMLSKKIK